MAGRSLFKAWLSHRLTGFPTGWRLSREKGDVRSRYSFASEDELPSNHCLPFPKPFRAPNFPDCVSHLHVCECVDKRVRHGDDNCAQQCKHFGKVVAGLM